MNLTRIEQENRSCGKNMVPSAAVRTHPPAVDNTDRRNPVKVPRKLVIFISTVE